MRIVAVDDENFALSNIIEILKNVIPNAEINGFDDPIAARDFIAVNGVDIAFLDIEMFDMNGIELAGVIRESNPRANIIFTTSYDEYTMDAMGMHASGYIMKPITEEKVQKELKDLRYFIQGDVQTQKRLRVNAFGSFEVYLDDQPVKFQYSKTKELLAYLIDRKGAMASNGEIIGVIWGDESDSLSKSSYLKNIRAELVKLFEKAGLEDALVHYRGIMGIKTEQIGCDYYDYLDGKENMQNAYRGEYMSQYSWGEYTNGMLYQEMIKD